MNIVPDITLNNISLIQYSTILITIAASAMNDAELDSIRVIGNGAGDAAAAAGENESGGAAGGDGDGHQVYADNERADAAVPTESPGPRTQSRSGNNRPPLQRDYTLANAPSYKDWLGTIFLMSDAELLAKCGDDALQYLR